MTADDESQSQRQVTAEPAYEANSYWETLLSGSFDSSGVAYAYLAVSFNDARYRAEQDVVRRALERHPSPAGPPSSALDIGCGTGIWIGFWRARGIPDITGVDLTEVAIARLEKAGVPASLMRADIGEAGLDLGRQFDVISVMSVLLHIVDADRLSSAVDNLARHLAPGGRLVLIEPVITQGWWGGDLGPKANSRVRTRDFWATEFDRHGLELLEIRPVTFLLANPIDARRSRTYQLWLRYWNYVLRFIGRRERVGAVAGRVLEWLDRPLRRSRLSGPSAKMMIVRHRDESPRSPPDSLSG
jgi:SAM-dependent methyltransferase